MEEERRGFWRTVGDLVTNLPGEILKGPSVTGAARKNYTVGKETHNWGKVTNREEYIPNDPFEQHYVGKSILFSLLRRGKRVVEMPFKRRSPPPHQDK